VLLNGTLWMTVRTAVSAHDVSPVQVLTAHEEIATSEAATSCGFLPYPSRTHTPQVVLYLTRILEAPKMIFLCSRCKPSQRVPEMVEANMPVGDVMALLVSR
jgi:hypothetical protein